jgi:hypothetical protein
MTTTHDRHALMPVRHVVALMACLATTACGGAVTGAAPDRSAAITPDAATTPETSATPVPTPAPATDATDVTDVTDVTDRGCDPTVHAARIVTGSNEPQVSSTVHRESPSGYAIDVTVPTVSTGNDVGDRISAALRTEAEQTIAPWDAWVEPYPSDEGIVYEAALVLQGEVVHIGATTINVVFDGYKYFPGAAHIIQLRWARSFDRATGDRLVLADLGFGPACLDALRPLVLAVFERDEVQVSGTSTMENWSLSPDGLTFHFYQYEIGPGSLGNLSATLTFTDVVDATGIDLDGA